MTFDQHHGAGWTDADPYPLKRLWLAVQYCSFKLLHLTLADASFGKSKTCVCLLGDGVDVKVRYITNIKEKRGGGIRYLCDHPSNATPKKKGWDGRSLALHAFDLDGNPAMEAIHNMHLI